MELKLKYASQTYLIDEEDYEKIKGYTWLLQAQRRDGYTSYYIKALSGHKNNDFTSPIFIYLHRFIMDCPNGMVVDHINGNTFDNRKTNLRICTKSENSKNRHRYNHVKNYGDIREQHPFHSKYERH